MLLYNHTGFNKASNGSCHAHCKYSETHEKIAVVSDPSETQSNLLTSPPYSPPMILLSMLETERGGGREGETGTGKEVGRVGRREEGRGQGGRGEEGRGGGRDRGGREIREKWEGRRVRE